MKSWRHNCMWAIAWAGILGAMCPLMISGKVALAETQAKTQAQPQPTAQAARTFDPAAFIMPEEVGHIVSTHLITARPTNASPVKTLIHIQDAHVNYEAQKHLALIVDLLAKQYGVQLVLVEGSSGDASLSYLRQYATLEKRHEVAERHLKSGLISGEEYVDLTVDYPLTLWGVESRPLYDANLKAMLNSETSREAVKPLLARYDEFVHQAAERIYPANLKALNAAAKRYEEGALPFADYLQQLTGWLSEVGFSTKMYPALTAFVQAHELEGQIDMARVQTEQTQALRALTSRVSQAEFAELVTRGREMQSEERAPASFYSRLEQLLTASGLPLEGYSHLLTYIHHTTLTASLATSDLSRELDQAAQQLRMVLGADPEVKHLAAMEQDVSILSRLFRLELTPDEYLTFVSQLEKQSLAKRWGPVLQAEKAPQDLVSSLPRIETAIPVVAEFYTVARQRNHVMVQKALDKMDELHAVTAILIAGGFHTPTLVKSFKERGVQVVVVAPKVTQATDEKLYHHMLKYKAGLEDELPAPTGEPHVQPKR